MDAVLQTLRAELSAIDGRRALLATAIASLEQLCGVALPPAAPAKPDVTPRDPVGASRVDALVAAERKASASLRGDEARVVELLSGRGEMSPKSIAGTLEMAPESCRWVLKKLRGKGLIETVGSTNKAVVRLKLAKAPATPVTGTITLPPSTARTVITTGSPRSASREVTSGAEELVPVWSGATRRSPEDVLRERREAQS